MKQQLCSYCSKFQALKKSDIFCSNYNHSGDRLQNNIFFLKNEEISSPKHISRYTIRYAFKGYQHFEVDGYHRTIAPHSILFLNEGASFITNTMTRAKVDLITVAFNTTFFEGVIGLSKSTHEELLDNPVTSLKERIDTSTRKPTNEIIILLLQIKALLKGNHVELMDQKLERLILNLFHFKEKERGNALGQLSLQKKSTRKELARRLTIGKDYMTSFVHQDIKINDVCKEIGMSKFHFIRTFKDFFGVSPYQFLKDERIRLSVSLLKNSTLDIFEIATLSGYESPSSFTRAFREKTGLTPTSIRK